MRRRSVLVLLLAFAMPAALAGEEASWEREMREQARMKLDCQVEYLVNPQAGEVAGRKTVQARLQCTDGRRFDGFRVEPDTDFQFHACDTQAC